MNATARVALAARVAGTVRLAARLAGAASLAILPLAARVPSAAAADAAADAGALHFARDGAAVATLDLAALHAACPEQTVEVDDPYYERRMRFRALPLRCVLEHGFGTRLETLAAEDFLLRALDGYERPATGAQLAEPGGWLAFADARRVGSAEALARVLADAQAERFDPIARRGLDPAPFYMVWQGEGRNDPHRHPWPFQLVAIEIVPFEARHPHTVPRASPPGSPARTGYALFRSQCIMCHAINHEGGRVGPELNVPRSIVEYRPVEQIKAYIRDPGAFRYTTMPAHPGLDDARLDALIAYFRAMSALKYDPPRRPAAQDPAHR